MLGPLLHEPEDREPEGDEMTNTRMRVALWVLAICLLVPPALRAESIQITSGVLSGDAAISLMYLQLSFNAPEASLSYSGAGAYPIGGTFVAPYSECGYAGGCDPGTNQQLDAFWHSYGVDTGQLTFEDQSYRVGIAHPMYPYFIIEFNGLWTVPDLGSDTMVSVTNPFTVDGVFVLSRDAPTEEVALFGYGLARIDLEREDSRWRVVSIQYTLTAEDPASVPEPSTLSLLGLGLAGVSVRRWRQRTAK